MKKTELYAPEGYWALPESVRKQYRCGPGRGILESLIPETMYGLNISAACSIHDYMYIHGATEEDRVIADEVFLNNLIRIIEANTTNKLLLCLRLRRAKTYYNAVRLFGGPSFWNDKNSPKEVGTA